MTDELNYSVQRLNLFKTYDKVAKLVYFNNKNCSERPDITEFNPVKMMAYCTKKLEIYENQTEST